MFFFSVRPWSVPLWCRCRRRIKNAAYRRTAAVALGAAHARIQPAELDRAPLVEAREPAHQDARGSRAALDRLRQDRGQFCGLGWTEIACRFSECPARAGFGAEFAVRP